jgi:hypothetical protein
MSDGNKNIVPLGCAETIDGSSTVIKNILLIRAFTDCALASVVRVNPPNPASGAAVDSFTLPAGHWLEYVASLTLTSGTCDVIYLPTPVTNPFA